MCVHKLQCKYFLGKIILVVCLQYCFDCTVNYFSHFSQPTVHFADEPIIRGGDDEDDNEDDGDRSDEDSRTPPPAEKQRLIRKDTPHYKKHFKITKLPKPEAVAALLQGFSQDGLSPTAHTPEDERDDGEEDEEEEEDDGVTVSTPLQHRLEAVELEDSRLSHVNSSLQPVKVRRRSRSGECVRY